MSEKISLDSSVTIYIFYFFIINRQKSGWNCFTRIKTSTE